MTIQQLIDLGFTKCRRANWIKGFYMNIPFYPGPDPDNTIQQQITTLFRGDHSITVYKPQYNHVFHFDDKNWIGIIEPDQWEDPNPELRSIDI